MLSATAAGTMLHGLVPSSESVAVSSVNVGPTPQMSSPGFAGKGITPAIAPVADGVEVVDEIHL
jgi:hypothetical protein